MGISVDKSETARINAQSAIVHETPEEWASANLTGMIIRALESRRPGIVSDQQSMRASTKTARTPAALKRALLIAAYEEGGAKLVLDLREDMRETGFNPLLHVLLHSANPAVMRDKWERFERYTHATNRLKLQSDGDRAFSATRFSTNGAAPHAAENIFICGVMSTLLEELGTKGLSLSLNGDDGTAVELIREGENIAPAVQLNGPATSGRFSWNGFSPSMGGVRAATDTLLHFGGDERQSTTKALVHLLSDDIARGWTWPELAERLEKPVRTLQRSLATEGTSLSELTRAVRVREACRLLDKNRLNLTQIGYWCGFSDSAHFSRDFCRSLGMPPSIYRETSKVNADAK